MGLAAPNWKKVQSGIEKKRFSFLLIIPADPRPRSNAASWATSYTVGLLSSGLCIHTGTGASLPGSESQFHSLPPV